MSGAAVAPAMTESKASPSHPVPEVVLADAGTANRVRRCRAVVPRAGMFARRPALLASANPHALSGSPWSGLSGPLPRATVHGVPDGLFRWIAKTWPHAEHRKYQTCAWALE